MRRTGLMVAAVVLVGSGITAPTAAPAPSNDIEIRIERDTQPRAAAIDLGVHHNVILTDRATGEPPPTVYQVLVRAINAVGEETEFVECVHATDVDSRVPRGHYNCTVFVDHGGEWDLVVLVNRKASAEAAPVTVARASTSFEVLTDQVYTGGDDRIQASATEMAIVWGHVLIAGAWFIGVTALAIVALPKLRQRLSAFGLYRLERRFDSLVKLIWSATIALVATGVYLLAEQTAYRTPTSWSNLNEILDLPYARPYFVSLGSKLGLYGLMLVALVPLMRRARQQLRAGVVPATSAMVHTPAPSGPAARTAPDGFEGVVLTALVEASAPELGGRRGSPPPTSFAQVGAIVLAIGALGISLCVTLLKYFHQIIEASP